MIDHLYIDRAVAGGPEAAAIENRLNIPTTIVEDPIAVYEAVRSAKDPIRRGKQVLFLTRNKGSFVRECPGTREYTCCGYTILHIGSFCVMDCSYCILQSYFHPPVLTYFVNHAALAAELKAAFGENRIQRIGTGEFTDSMIWEPITRLSNFLVPQFARQSRAVLELKTKTTAVDALEHLDHNRKTIVSWSLNTPRIIASEERGTAALDARLRAAARCQSWGYPLAFHFDPMVLYHGCEAEYRSVVQQLFDHVTPDNIAWISIGTFRFMPDLKSIIESRFRRSKIIYGEFVPGLDGKMRYFKPLRMALYRKMTAWIRDRAPNVTVYFCMEDDAVWIDSMGFLPAERGGLTQMLDKAAARVCGVGVSD